MEVKPGYKHTEVGVIPEEWRVISIGAIANVKTGPFGSALHESDYVFDGTPIITVEHLSDYGVLHQNLPMVSDYDRNRLNMYSLSAGDIVFSRVGSVDRNFIISKCEEGWLFSGRLLRIRPDRNVTFPPYVSYHFQSESFKQRVYSVAVGQTMASLNTQIIRNVLIALPPLPEQRAIAEVLSNVDALITALDKLIAKKRAIKQGAMQELLTGTRRLPGFSGEWNNYRFDEITYIRNEKVDPKTIDYIPFCIELEHIESGSGQLTGYTTITKESSIKARFYSGDVLFGRLRSYLKKYWLADKDGVCSTEIWPLISITEVVTPMYLYQLIQTNEFINVASSAYGTHMPRSDWNVVKNHMFPIPSLTEQRAIAAVLSDMDAEIAALEQQRDKTNTLKQGMMQELLTGRIRLNHDVKD